MLSAQETDMRRHRTLVRSVVAVALAVVAFTTGAAQTRQATRGDGTYVPPRTAWGDPDLEGVWPSTHMVGVPFERPDQFGTRLLLTDAELKEREAAAARQQELDVLDF